MEKIKWGIIGPGSIANNFADGLKGSYSGQLVSIASKNEDRRKIFGDKYDIHPDFRFDNYDDISFLKSNHNVIIGNTCLYGATKGTLYAAGKAGDRFAVRNSGANAVIEGCGDNGCEYMTGGSVVILGEVGNNFGAGMTGGMAFAYDKEGTLPLRINLEDVFYQQQMTPYWEGVLYDKIQHYYTETNSQHAKEVLDNWDRNKYLFWQIIPKEMVNKFEQPVLVETTKTA